MGRSVLSVEKLGKRYRLGVIGHATLHDEFERWWAGVRGKPDPSAKIGAEPNSRMDTTLWALRDVNVAVDEGTSLGVVGANGAGKSTLLKILSRVTAPTEGRVRIKGRVASLLEIGTGFHPELTGRDNVFLNGAILGMARNEIARKFDEIVAFADVGPFIDTPVKRYSSGMYVRLAFAVAAHVDPDIFIVDEVLAVGDVNFQKKCLGKMHELAEGQRRTVLFVSHNMAAIKSLCNRAILLEHGRLVIDGGVDEVVRRYIDGSRPTPTGVISDARPAIGTGEVRLLSVQLLDSDERPISELYLGERFAVAFEIDVRSPVADAVFEVNLSTLDGTFVTTNLSVDGAEPSVPLQPGRHRIRLDLDVVLLPNQYTIDLGVHHTGPPWTMDFARRTLDFQALNVAKSGGDRFFYDVQRGFVRPAGRWRIG